MTPLATSNRRPWTGGGLRRERWTGYLFIAPAFLFLACIVAVPLGQAVWMSLLRIRGLNTRFAGLANYTRALADPAFWHSLRLSLVFTIVCVVLHVAIGLGLALLLARANRARGVLRVAFLTPWMIAPAIGATIWLWLLEPQFGVANYLLSALGVIASPVSWLGTPGTAFGAVIAVDVWREVPFVMLLLLAGLLAIPAEQYEAASIDGASPWRRFLHVTLPNLRALLVIASTLDVINTIRQFDIINVMTGGGPVNGTEVLPALIYNTAFRANDLGGAAAIGILLLSVVLVFSTVYIGVLKPARRDA
jgi:multiple sugar transport system permease protein